MNEEVYGVYDGRKWMGWGISATMSRGSSLPDVAKDIIIHHPYPGGELVIPYAVMRVLSSHIQAAFQVIDRVYSSQDEYREEKRREWNDSLPSS